MCLSALILDVSPPARPYVHQSDQINYFKRPSSESMEQTETPEKFPFANCVYLGVNA